MTLQNVEEYQYELFPQTEIEMLNSKIIAIHEMAHNVRKGIFKRQNDLEQYIYQNLSEIKSLQENMILRLQKLEEKHN